MLIIFLSEIEVIMQGTLLLLNELLPSFGTPSRIKMQTKWTFSKFDECR